MHDHDGTDPRWDLAAVLGALPEPRREAIARLLRSDPDPARLARALRRAGSSEVTRSARALSMRDPDASVEAVVRDAAQAVGARIPAVCDLDAALRRIAEAVVDRSVLARTDPAEAALASRPRAMRASALRALGLPLIHHAGGATGRALGDLAAGAGAAFVAGGVTRAAMALALARLPWAAALLGPAAWAVALAPVALALQGPARRRTVPALVFLAVARESALAAPAPSAAGVA